MTTQKTVLVVGGGPAGSTAATLLAQAGMRVRLLERHTFPRYHIGESLTPSCRTVLGLSGAQQKVEAHAFQIKRGAEYQWGLDNWIVDWERQFGPEVHTWQVDRAQFDQLLLEHAREQGVEVVENATARAVRFDDERPAAVDWIRGGQAGGGSTASGFDYLIDASGRTGLLSAQHYHNRRQHEIFKNVATWGYWRIGDTLPATPEGGLNCISTPTGWYWVIPLGDRTSVGFVTHRDHFQKRRPEYASVEEMYLAFVRESGTVRGLVEGAEFLGPARVEQDYSYVADRFCGPGHFLIGDAAAFLDPLLGTGVHLALYSALLSAACITAVADGQATETEALGFYEYSYRRAYTRLLALVSGMYDRYRGKEDYFWLAQRLVGEKTRYTQSNEAFGEILTGLVDLREAANTDSRILTRQLLDEAEQAQRAATQASPDRPDFTPLMGMPTDAHTSDGLSLVTAPRLGLRRTPRHTHEAPDAAVLS
ncbi:NAD(P)/FAD-dependent oxidoreductase [Streptomyces sp. NPDC015127]|uniref:NAD(P)/FAD-dependent oxidoreductase n=1 Tax=Streptomyces sp. NPDC015127 TaxID=3364939 RepID=UPI0037009F10